MGLIGLAAGVSLTERPEVVSASLATKAYYSLGLFVVGGLDIGTPVGGPPWARMLLWIAYFGAPVFTATAVIDALVRAVARDRWQLRGLRDHVVVSGSSWLTDSFLRALRARNTNIPVVVLVERTTDMVRRQELEQSFGALVLAGELDHAFMQRQLQLKRARRIVLLGESDFQAYEAAHRIVGRFPALRERLVLHCNKLRFLRTMQRTGADRLCISFNSYHLAATAFVSEALIPHLRETPGRDLIVLAGFGRFGQAVLEELQHVALDQIDRVVAIDRDAQRRMLVVEEQEQLHRSLRRDALQGDIAHPEVWRRLRQTVNLDRGQPILVLGTGSAENNLRTALWLKGKYPSARIYARTNDRSELAEEIGTEHSIHTMSITELVERNLPEGWLT